MKTRNRRATAAVRHLAADGELRAEFRRDPRAAMARWNLDDDQLEAIKAGDAASLAAAGIDVDKVDSPPVSLRMRARLFAVLATVLGMVGGPAAGTAFAARARQARFGPRYIRARAIRVGARIRANGVRAARRYSNGVRLRVRLHLVPDGCKDVKYCGVFEIVE